LSCAAAQPASAAASAAVAGHHGGIAAGIVEQHIAQDVDLLVGLDFEAGDAA
jgi:hypothetical protein